MKRTRAESQAAKLTAATGKPNKKCRDLTTKAASPAASPLPLLKPREEERQPETVAQETEAEEYFWDSGSVELGCCWWGVEEELLLGFFPFVDEHFIFSDLSGGGGGGAAHWDDYHDIWRVKQIHEIPSSKN